MDLEEFNERNVKIESDVVPLKKTESNISAYSGDIVDVQGDEILDLIPQKLQDK